MTAAPTDDDLGLNLVFSTPSVSTGVGVGGGLLGGGGGNNHNNKKPKRKTKYDRRRERGERAKAAKEEEKRVRRLQQAGQRGSDISAGRYIGNVTGSTIKEVRSGGGGGDGSSGVSSLAGIASMLNTQPTAREEKKKLIPSATTSIIASDIESKDSTADNVHNSNNDAKQAVKVADDTAGEGEGGVDVDEKKPKTDVDTLSSKPSSPTTEPIKQITAPPIQQPVASLSTIDTEVSSRRHRVSPVSLCCVANPRILFLVHTSHAQNFLSFALFQI